MRSRRGGRRRDRHCRRGGAARALPADRWAVVTSAGHELALARLAAVGLPRPPVLVGADDVAAGKPAPDGYLKPPPLWASRPSARRDRGHAAGALAGRAAGATVIGLRTTFASVEPCDFLVDDLRAVRALRAPDGSLRALIVSAPR